MRFNPIFRRAGLCALLCMVMVDVRGQQNSSAEPVFDVWEYAVQGNTVLSVTAIERAVYPYLGPGRRVRDVEAARLALETAYRKAGYGTVQVLIPEQAVDSGVVELKVVPGRVRRVRVEGSRYYDQGRILERVPSLAAGSTPNFNAAQAQLNSVNRFPGRRVTPVLRAGEEPGTTEVDLKVEEKRPYGGGLELNNRRSANTSSTRLNASLHYDNLWQRQHSLSLQYQTAPEKPKEVQVWSLSYDAPDADSEDHTVFYGYRSNSNVATLGDVTVLGQGKIAGLRRIHRLADYDRLTHSFTAGVDYKSFNELVTLPGSSAIVTPLRYAPFSLSYEAAHPAGEGFWRLSTGVNFAIRGLITKQTEFADKRFKARGNYVAWKWDVQRLLPLPKKYNLLLRVDGQLADQPLVSNEQYAAGGADTVRGYLESEALGDQAVHTSIELRSPLYPVKWAAREGSIGLHLFFDAASLRLRDPLPGQTSRFQLASTGLGVRYTSGGLKVSLTDGWALKRTTNTGKGDMRIHFEVRYDF